MWRILFIYYLILIIWIIKRLLTLFSLVLFAFSYLNADETKLVVLNFEKNDFSFVENNLKEILVVPNAQSAYYLFVDGKLEDTISFNNK